VVRLRAAVTALSSLRRARPTLLIAFVVLALGLSACGLVHRPMHQTFVSATEISTGFEPYFFAGPVTYQIEVTRQLNPFDHEDQQYFGGVPNAQGLPGTQLWFGVFLWAKNQNQRPVTTTDTFTITDSAGTTYHPITLNPTLNPYAWTAQQLGPNAIEPDPDTTAGEGPTQGGLILFRLNTASYANRPLTLHVYVPGQAQPSGISLDL
jgi:hypothetical protein